MRKTDREITEPGLVDRIIRSAQVCRLGLARDNVPYVVPVSFGYDGAAVYIHTAPEGRKVDFFRANPLVCLEFEREVRILPDGERACKWSASYQSVIGYGRIRELTAPEEKQRGLGIIMNQYSARAWSFDEKALNAARVWQITIEQLSGKQSKDRIAG